MNSEVINLITAISTAGGIIIALIVFIINFRIKIKIQKAEYLYRLEDKYDKICEFRASHVELVEIGEAWKEKEYSDYNKLEKQYWYFYEMTFGFIETAVYMTFKDKSISEKDFHDFLLPLIDMEIKYNRGALLQELKQEKNFISQPTNRFLENYILYNKISIN